MTDIKITPDLLSYRLLKMSQTIEYIKKTPNRVLGVECAIRDQTNVFCRDNHTLTANARASRILCSCQQNRTDPMHLLGHNKPAI